MLPRGCGDRTMRCELEFGDVQSRSQPVHGWAPGGGHLAGFTESTRWTVRNQGANGTLRSGRHHPTSILQVGHSAVWPAEAVQAAPARPPRDCTDAQTEADGTFITLHTWQFE